MAILRHFLQLSPNSFVKSHYFTFVKKRLLHAAADARRNDLPGANPRRGQERETGLSARLGIGRNATLLP
jgi:hypothetical protein